MNEANYIRITSDLILEWNFVITLEQSMRYEELYVLL